MNTDADDDLVARIARARVRLDHQHDPALTQTLSDAELAAERDLAEFARALERRGRRADADTAAAAAARIRRTNDEIARLELDVHLGAARALATHRRTSDPAARLAGLDRYRIWSARALGAVIAVGMGWSAVNVQRNIARDLGVADPLFWFSYGLEAMISVCLVVIMLGGRWAEEFRVQAGRHAVTATEVVLLAATLGLNTYPYVRAAAWFDAAVHGAAPVMIAVALVIHHAVSARCAAALHIAAPQVQATAPAAPAPASPQVNTGAPQVHPAPAPANTPAPTPAPPRAAAPAPPPPAPAPAPTTAAPAPAPEPVVQVRPEVQALAAELVAEGKTKQPVTVVAAVITAADAEIAAGRAQPRVTVIGRQERIHTRTVHRIINAATEHRARGARVVVSLHAAQT
ncbi:hypothetical protein ACTD5D_00360 [Nocardia takedensis]|uniref:hypothetical protein n=1 Tax=Nocardia takedensis TaxID=259390 RepID=UPI003F758ED5